MSKELLWLTLTVILTGLMWVPYILDRIMVRGLMGAMANPSRNDKPQSAWAQRLYFAHTNAVENLIIFAPLVLILDAQGYSTEGTVIACAVYFWARLAHAVVYTMGVPVLRTLALASVSRRKQRSHWRCSENSSWLGAARSAIALQVRLLAAIARTPSRPRHRGEMRKRRRPPRPARV